MIPWLWFLQLKRKDFALAFASQGSRPTAMDRWINNGTKNICHFLFYLRGQASVRLSLDNILSIVHNSWTKVPTEILVLEWLERSWKVLRLRGEVTAWQELLLQISFIQIFIYLFFFNGQIQSSFLFIFVLFTSQFNNSNWKKHSLCAWDSNRQMQDGRRRQNHRAMAAAQSWIFDLGTWFTNWFLFHRLLCILEKNLGIA